MLAEVGQHDILTAKTTKVDGWVFITAVNLYLHLYEQYMKSIASPFQRNPNLSKSNVKREKYQPNTHTTKEKSKVMLTLLSDEI